ncbi:hypothetical protein AB3Y40_06850 [Yoonia sp. R2331]|uniref:hypothetical protein n=1 Tax=Yoonia sp. R2331 TaxID=3237238 RepID=UPI0034E6107E
MTNTFVGIAAVGGFLSFAVSAIVPEVPPITVRSLEYESGIIHQSRTITAEGPVFFATWQAEILDRNGVIVCSGSGSWNYTVGHRIADIPLNEWVGDDGCSARLEQGAEYTPVASWFWGSDQTTHKGDPFTF